MTFILFSFLLQPGEGVSQKVLTSYCWMYSTFNIPPDFEGQCARKSQSDNPVYNSYYQWVSIFLIFQAFLFYLPRIVWIMSEGGEYNSMYFSTNLLLGWLQLSFFEAQIFLQLKSQF